MLTHSGGPIGHAANPSSFHSTARDLSCSFFFRILTSVRGQGFAKIGLLSL